MYPVSNAYRAAMKAPSQQFRVTGTIGEQSFSDVNILAGSFNITNQCSDGSDIMIGQVYSAELNITLRGLGFTRYSIKSQQICPSFGMLVGPDTWEDIPLGVFNPVEIDHGASGVTIKAYDNMVKFDVDFPRQNLAENTLYAYAQMACTACGVQLGTTENEFMSMVNTSYAYELPINNDTETFRDLVAWIAQCMCCVAVIGRDGKLYFQQYHTAVDDTIDAEHRFADARFSDFSTHYSGVTLDITSLGTKMYMSADSNTGGYTYDLGSNPLLQTKSLREVQCKNIANALSTLAYVPFECSGIGNPAYDLMDVIVFSGGAADSTKISCVTKWEFNYHDQYKMSGAGRNPALASAQSKTDKSLSGMRSQTASHIVIDHVPTASDLSGSNGTIYLVISGGIL